MLFALCHILVEIWSSYQRKSAGEERTPGVQRGSVFFKLPPKVKCLEKPFFFEGSAYEMGPGLRCLKISLLQNDEKVQASYLH